MARLERVVFFDIGNVIIDDDPFLSELSRLLHQSLPPKSPKAHLERFKASLERAFRVYGHKAIERLGYRYHSRRWPKIRKNIQKEINKRWWELVRMIPGAPPVLQELKRNYSLGIIANQPIHIVECLEEWGLLPCFDVVLLDSQYGVAKPEVNLFRLAMEQARADPQASLMVGDRLDNDVIPARRLGMRAVLLWLNVKEKGWTPKSEWDRAFWEILERQPAPRWDEILPKERPMTLVRRWNELPTALDRVWGLPL